MRARIVPPVTSTPPIEAPPPLNIAPGTDPAATERILRTLPDWFGIEGALLEYVDAARHLTGFLARVGDDVVGVLLLERHFPEAAEIHLMAVHPEHHRQGIGRALVAAAVAQLADDGARFLQVKTLAGSYPSEHYAQTRRFYRAMGFLPLEVLPDLWPGNPCLVLVRTLG